MTYQYKKAPTNRQLKVSETIRKEIAQIFLKDEVFYPEMENIVFTVLDVKTSSDLKISTIFISPVDKKTDIDLIKFLNIIAPEYRKKLCTKMKLRFIPQIRFQIDQYIDERIDLEKLLDNISRKKL